MQRFCALTTVLAITACGGGGGDDGGGIDGGPADATAACQQATTYQELSAIRENIFKRSCAFMDCHDALAPESEMDLTGTNTHSLLVNVESNLLVADGWSRVVPNDPANSYLLVILGRGQGPIDPNIGNMPQNSPLLCAEKLDAIERWILAGALDN